jgi:protein tyrosine/serine phosphatase
MYFPPINFAVVQEGLYRSGLPSEVNFPFLERLNLRTIVYLFPEDGIRPAL